MSHGAWLDAAYGSFRALSGGPVRRIRNYRSGAHYPQFLVLSCYEPMPYDRESVLTIGAVQEALTVNRADLVVAGERYRRDFPTSGPDADDRLFYVGFHFSDAGPISLLELSAERVADCVKDENKVARTSYLA